MAKNFWQEISIKKILIFSLLIRLILCPWIFHGDVTATYWWGKFAAEFSWRGYYDWLEFGGYIHPDQPMLNIIYDWLIKIIYDFFYRLLWFLNIKIPIFPSNFMQWYFLNGNQIMLKLPMIFADLLIIYFVFKFVSEKFSITKAKFATLILSVYPPLIYNSAIWGSGDSIINLFALLAVYCLYNKKYFRFVLFIFISLLYKSSLVIWIPILLLILIKQKIKINEYIKMFLESLLLIFLVSHPFAIKNSFIWFYETITEKILPGVMPQITANAMNFWALIFGLQPKLDEMMFFSLISVRNLSLIICIIFYAFILFKLYKNFTSKNILLALTQITLITFTFMTRMHERYTFPALIPLLILCFYHKKYQKYFVVLSITHLLNVYNWWWVPPITPLITLLNQDVFIRLISLTNLILTLSLLFKNENRD